MTHLGEPSPGPATPADRRTWRGLVRAAAADRDALVALLDPVASRAASDDHEALEALIWAVDELHLARSAIRLLVVQEADAEEVEQDVLVVMAETIGSFRGEARFTTWLHQVARYKAIAHLRRRRDALRLGEEEEVGDAVRISSMIASRTVLDDAIGGLPDLYRDAVVLRDVEQLPYAEVAERLELNLNTVKARVARGRALAAAKLREGR